ncbi:MAG: multicopper oxidase family protein [Acidobacteriaceae bacterium]
MSAFISRRSFLASGIACGAAGMLGCTTSSPQPAQGTAPSEAMPPLSNAIRMAADMRTVEVNGKSSKMMGLALADGKSGLILNAAQPFDVLLENKLPVPTAIHWHGLHPPNNEDGVPGLTQAPIQPGASHRYYFPLKPSGTHWMHSHLGLQEAFLLAAPLIVHGKVDQARDEQEIILFLGDFSFTPPPEIYAKLRKPASPMSSPMSARKASMAMDKPDANDVDYDAYLANDRTLMDPEVVSVENNGKVRLRIINGSSGTNYFVSLEGLKGELIATDGMPVEPVTGSLFPLAIAQRIDIRVQLPHEGAFPILALREFAREQTGIILATRGAAVRKLPLKNMKPAGFLNLDLEKRLLPLNPPPARPVDQTFDLRRGGNMARYEWTINGVAFDTAAPGTQKPLVRVKQGQRVSLNFINETPMSHPMHLHGHSFQVTSIDGASMRGALRDTVLVPGKSTVTVTFDADNPGTWYVHCHVLWHLAAGMATLVQYEA